MRVIVPSYSIKYYEAYVLNNNDLNICRVISYLNHARRASIDYRLRYIASGSGVYFA